jgi:ligand-binding SRPBCC domain-containing protein
MITLTETTLIAAPIDRCFDLARSVEVHLTGNIHFGEQAVAVAVEPGGTPSITTGLLALGDTVTWQARHFLIRQRLTSRITAYNPNHHFQDTMVHGVFHSMQHDHHFQAILSDGSAALTLMHDVFRFTAPIPLLGRVAETLLLRRYVRALLKERNAAIKEIAESPTEAWRGYLSQPVLASS